MATIHTFQSHPTVGSNASGRHSSARLASSLSAYPACPLAARPARLHPPHLTWDELLGQR